MNFDAERWSLLEKAHDYRFILRLFAFALVADLLLALAMGSNLWALHWADVGARPGLWVMMILAYGFTMTLGASIVSYVVMDLLNLVVPTIQIRLGLSPDRPTPNPMRYVAWSDAEVWLTKQADATRRQPVEQRMAERREDRVRWHSVVNNGWACLALLTACLFVPRTCVALLGQWQAWAPWLLFVMPALPCAYHVWVGVPGHDMVELPERAEELYRQRYSRGRAFACNN